MIHVVIFPYMRTYQLGMCHLLDSINTIKQSQSVSVTNTVGASPNSLRTSLARILGVPKGWRPVLQQYPGPLESTLQSY
jgi:predicted metallopeptidase